jgi:hypothetical protein
VVANNTVHCRPAHWLVNRCDAILLSVFEPSGMARQDAHTTQPDGRIVPLS